MAHLRRAAVAAAARRHGAIDLATLARLGVDRHRARRWAGEGWLTECAPGVFVLAGRDELKTQATVGVLAGGPTAVAGRATAGALWEMVAEVAGPVSVIVPRGCRRPRDGIDFHTTRSLPRTDVTRHFGIPVTRPARTLVDLGLDHDEAAVEAALHAGLASGCLGESTMRDRLRDVNGRRGAVALGEMLIAASEGFTRSEAERMLRDVVHEGRFPRPRFNHWLLGRERDAVWVDDRIVVEVHGHRWHRSAPRFEDDAVRVFELEAAGWRVLQLTYRLLRDHPFAVVARLGHMLELPPLGRLAPRRR